MSRTPTEELTLPGRAVRRATGYNAAPAWVAVALAVIYIRQEIIWWTDSAYRRSLLDDLPSKLAYLTEVANVVMSMGGAAGALFALWNFLFRPRPHGTRSTDG